MTETEIDELEQLWDDFLRRWPLEELESMPIGEYTSMGTSDSFTYWLESRTEKLGSIWGGSSFKFGVYSRRDTTEKISTRKSGYTKEYGWLNKYGESPENAYKVIMQEIVKTAKAARAGDLSVIDKVDLGHAYRWKIAFLYQDRKNPSVVGIYSRQSLRALNDSGLSSSSEIQSRLMASRGTHSLFEYGSQLWERYVSMKKSPLTVEEALEYLQLSDILSPIKQATKALAGFESDNGQHLALRLKPEDVLLYLSPGDWMSEASKHYKKIKEYDKESPRSSNLAANAPNLALGYPCVKINVNTLDDLIELINVYTEQEDIGSKASKEKTEANTHATHNQILFGPPGTGKTYITTEYAVGIADPEWVEKYYLPLNDKPDQQRAAMKERYLELIDEQRIVFTTFHQSFSYEDFIEGIRPETNGDKGHLTYSVKDGIFKELCENAQSTVLQRAEAPLSLTGRRIWKMSLGNTLGDEDEVFEECLEENCILLGYGGDTDYSGCDDRQSVKERLQNVLGQVVDNNDYTITAVNVFKNLIKSGDLIVVSDGNHKFRAIAEIVGDYQLLEARDRITYLQKRSVRWLRHYSPSLSKDRIFKKALSQMTLYELKSGTIDHRKFSQLLAPEDQRQIENKPHVMIIDEINRGNISRIFGELITLIESSKRKGAADEQITKLPYSQQPFCIPNNVFLIGTMNTADKSLAQMDLALRRRFNFIEVPPKPNMLQGIEVHGVDLSELLDKINQRIEALLDAEHQIGHAYFLPLKEMTTGQEREQALGLIFRNKILPLLQEYFFDDYERIGWVLNDPVKETEHCFIRTAAQTTSLTKLSGLFSAEVAEQLTDRRFKINSNAFELAEAYQGIIA